MDSHGKFMKPQSSSPEQRPSCRILSAGALSAQSRRTGTLGNDIHLFFLEILQGYFFIIF